MSESSGLAERSAGDLEELGGVDNVPCTPTVGIGTRTVAGDQKWDQRIIPISFLLLSCYVFVWSVSLSKGFNPQWKGYFPLSVFSHFPPPQIFI